VEEWTWIQQEYIQIEREERKGFILMAICQKMTIPMALVMATAGSC
jgi:hypothetical protein